MAVVDSPVELLRNLDILEVFRRDSLETPQLEPHKIRTEQCQAARGIEAEFGTQKALDYLIDEKFINFLEAAETDKDFRCEIPAFVAEIKSIFEPTESAPSIRNHHRSFGSK